MPAHRRLQLRLIEEMERSLEDARNITIGARDARIRMLAAAFAAGDEAPADGSTTMAMAGLRESLDVAAEQFEVARDHLAVLKAPLIPEPPPEPAPQSPLDRPGPARRAAAGG